MTTLKWTKRKIQNLFCLPFFNLLYKAQKIHRKHFDPQVIQTSTLLSIKTGACPEDCKYCPQSARYKTGIKVEKLLSLEEVLLAAKKAKEKGATRFCMAGAWRNPKDKNLEQTIPMIQEVKKLGLETCVTFGMLTLDQAHDLKTAGLDFYNHNLDTSPEFYPEIISTRTYEDRLETLENVRKANIKVCCGGILGMGEHRKDRVSLLFQLVKQTPALESVPINLLSKVSGTPLGDSDVKIDNFEFIRTIAVARILMPLAYVRLTAGRHMMSDEMQALCFLAGANSIFYLQPKLLTTPNPQDDRDTHLFERLNLIPLGQDSI